MVADDEELEKKRKQLKASLLIDFDDMGGKAKVITPPSKWEKDLMVLFGIAE
jgi:hypothetical protein